MYVARCKMCRALHNVRCALQVCLLLCCKHVAPGTLRCTLRAARCVAYDHTHHSAVKMWLSTLSMSTNITATSCSAAALRRREWRWRVATHGMAPRGLCVSAGASRRRGLTDGPTSAQDRTGPHLLGTYATPRLLGTPPHLRRTGRVHICPGLADLRGTPEYSRVPLRSRS